MPEQTIMDNRTLLRRTLITIGAMVGACIVVVGSLTLVAQTVVGHAVGPKEGTAEGNASASGPATAQHVPTVGPRPAATTTGPQRK
jgi:hypothetical protein